MKALALALLLVAGCASTRQPSRPHEMWPALQAETVALIAGAQACGPVSLRIGFCRTDAHERPSREEAALSDGCRGQPAAYLAAPGAVAGGEDRRAAAGALADLFAAAPFGETLAGLDERSLLKAIHDRDQALRFYRPPATPSNPQVLENSKWVAICAHALFARQVVGRFLERTTPEALSADEDLANHAWLLVQHSDFDPAYQLRMSQWFGSVQAPHMRKHAAFLHDRAMVGLHRPQLYGTQLRCNEGVREPFPVEDVAGMDARRIALGLAPMTQHLATFPRPCPPPAPRS